MEDYLADFEGLLYIPIWDDAPYEVREPHPSRRRVRPPSPHPLPPQPFLTLVVRAFHPPQGVPCHATRARRYLCP